MIATLAALVLLAPAAAAAVRGTLRRTPLTPLQVAERAAVTYWHADPCGGKIKVLSSASVPKNLDTGGVKLGSAWAWTSFNTPRGRLDYGAPPHSYTDCVITINSAVWTAPMESFEFPEFCALIVHEFGHLRGYADKATYPRTSITYPEITALNDHVTPCVRRSGLFAATG